MIISKTPYRVSLFGGGTDYPDYVRTHGGEVLGFAINKYCYISLRKLPPFFEYKSRLVWSEVELVKEFSEIKHPAIRAILEEHCPYKGIELHHDGDLPARTGMGSSSSFTVGLLNAFWALMGDQASKHYLAKEAIRIEQDVLKENVGCQDQVWAAYGGFNHVSFAMDGSFEVYPVVMKEVRRREFQESLMLVFTGFSRFSSEIASEQVRNIHVNERHLRQMRVLVSDALTILRGTGPLDAIGRLLHESWRLKRELAENITSDYIDLIYEAARSAGAIGGKLLGAGGGGFMLLFVPPDRQESVRKRLDSLIHVPFQMAMEGSRIALYEPGGLDGAEW